MKAFRFLRTVAFVCTFSLLLPFAVSCSDGTTDEPSAESNESTPESEPSSEETKKETVTVGDADLEIDGVNVTPDGKGIYVFTPDYEGVATPASDGDFFDVAVIDSSAVSVYPNRTTAIIPSDGFVVRFYKVEQKVSVGDEIKIPSRYIAVTPQKYVRFGDKVIEVGHENEIRTDEDTGWLYDSRWYSATTTSNIWCTEIAIKDGKIVEINRSGDSVGDTRIPEGGYVIAVGQGSSSERKTSKLQVGDEAELFLGEKLYNVKNFGYAGENRTRPEDGIVIFTREKYQTTPIGNNVAEIVVNKDNRIIGIYPDCSGMKKIPDGGYIISAMGNTVAGLVKYARIGAHVFEKRSKVFCISSTPDDVYSELKSTAKSLREQYDELYTAVAFIDFKAASEKLAEIESVIKNADENKADGNTLAAAIESLLTLTKEVEALLIPQITVQDRMAWVTLGEYDYSKNIILHYKTQEDVDHTVAYAKSVGLNTLIIDNLAACYAVYDSNIEGIVKLPQLGDVDLIEAFSKACKEQGIRLIVMVNAFSSGIDGVAYPKDHYMSVYKDKYLITNKGRHVGPDGVITLDPADPDVQAFNLAVLKEICEKYDVYGVQADYMRYPLPWFYQAHNYEDFGFNESSTAGFIKKYGKDPATLSINDPLWEKWCAWKRDIISDYQKRFYQTAKSVNPELNVSFTCFADYRDRQIYTCQDVEKWAENGYADAIYPMIYGETTEYQLDYVQKNLQIAESTDMVIGVGAYVKATHESMQEQLFMNYDVAVEGVSVFTLRYISICGYDSLFRKAFSKEATPTDEKDDIFCVACAEMISNRLDNIIFVTEDEASKIRVKSVMTDFGMLNTADISFGNFKNQLKGLRDDFASIADETASEKAVIALFDYILGL